MKSVEECFTHFITVEIIIEIPNFYFESLKEPELKKFMHHSLHKSRKGRELKFIERPCINKI